MGIAGTEAENIDSRFVSANQPLRPPDPVSHIGRGTRFEALTESTTGIRRLDHLRVIHGHLASREFRSPTWARTHWRDGRRLVVNSMKSRWVSTNTSAGYGGHHTSVHRPWSEPAPRSRPWHIGPSRSEPPVTRHPRLCPQMWVSVQNTRVVVSRLQQPS